MLWAAATALTEGAEARAISACMGPHHSQLPSFCVARADCVVPKLSVVSIAICRTLTVYCIMPFMLPVTMMAECVE